jgi:hypothetical protein
MKRTALLNMIMSVSFDDDTFFRFRKKQKRKDTESMFVPYSKYPAFKRWCKEEMGAGRTIFKGGLQNQGYVKTFKYLDKIHGEMDQLVRDRLDQSGLAVTKRLEKYSGIGPFVANFIALRLIMVGWCKPDDDAHYGPGAVEGLKWLFEGQGIREGYNSHANQADALTHSRNVLRILPIAAEVFDEPLPLFQRPLTARDIENCSCFFLHYKVEVEKYKPEGRDTMENMKRWGEYKFKTYQLGQAEQNKIRRKKK